jgi:hypothetical protein
LEHNKKNNYNKCTDIKHTKLSDAKQAKDIYQYENIKQKVLKTNAGAYIAPI